MYSMQVRINWFSPEIELEKAKKNKSSSCLGKASCKATWSNKVYLVSSHPTKRQSKSNQKVKIEDQVFNEKFREP